MFVAFERLVFFDVMCHVVTYALVVSNFQRSDINTRCILTADVNYWWTNCNVTPTEAIVTTRRH